MEAGNQMSDGITALSSCQPGGLSTGVTIGHHTHVFGMDHVIGRYRQRTAQTFSLLPFFRTEKAQGSFLEARQVSLSLKKRSDTSLLLHGLAFSQHRPEA